MSFISEFVERMRAVLFPGTMDREMEEELAFHLEMEERENLRRGMGPDEARRQAALRLGGRTQVVEATRESRGVRSLEDLLRDVRFAFRSFARSLGFTLTAVLVLGIGIGATTAIFSAVRAVVLEPLPFSDPGSLYQLWESNPESGWEQGMVSPPNYLDLKERVVAFADVEAYSDPSQVTVTGVEQPLVLDQSVVTGGFFSMLGVRPALGRDFREEETWAGATWRAGETPILLSANTWSSLFGGDQAVIGRTVTYGNGGRARIIGVMPEGFAFPTDDVDVWAPVGWAEENRGAAWFRRAHSIRPIARLAPGAAPERAAAELGSVVAQLERENPESAGLIAVGMSPLHDSLLRETRTPLLVLLGAVALMLLIACANVGNLMLVRASARGRELAVRSALGAGRGRLVRQMLTESLVLAALGGLLGVALAVTGTRILERLQPEGLLRVTSFPVDAGVIAFALAITTSAAILFGVFPALFARRVGPGETMRAAGRTGRLGRHTGRAIGGLVMMEVALAVLLLLGAGLLVRSILELRQVDPGFRPDGAVVVTLSLPGSQYPVPTETISFYDELLTRIRVLPDVESAAASSALPLRNRGSTSDFSIAGRAPDEHGTEALVRTITPGYLETMGVPLLAGRAFTDTDVFTGGWDEPRSDRVALINQALADEYFPGEDPVGQRISTDRVPDSSTAWRTIVGVVGNERQSEIAIPAQVELFEPFGQFPERSMHVYARVGSGDPMRLVPAIRSIVQDLDPNLPLYDALAMEEVVRDSTARDRFLMLLLLCFAVVAVVLALVGVYGVTAQAARQRLPELGLRLALGARSSDVVRLTVRRSLVLVSIGLGLGVAAALVATRVLSGMLYEVAATDTATFIAVPVLLAAAALAASWLPALRAARLDPATILRAE